MRGYTPEFVARLRQAYEQTERPLRLMATDFRIGERTLYRIAQQEGWTRMPRGLPRALRALEEASALLTSPGDASASPIPPIGEDALPGSSSPLRGSSDDAAPAEPPEQRDATAHATERIAHLVQQELAAAEVMRAQLRAGDCAPIDAERMARTLSTLTQTLQTLQRLRAGAITNGGDPDDDIPTDIDAFRRDLARRIDAFVASRIDGTDDRGDCGLVVDGAGA